MRIKLIIILLSIATIVTISGCRNPMVDPARAFLNTVGTEYLEYVEKDPALDERDKQARRINVESFRLLVEEADK